MFDTVLSITMKTNDFQSLWLTGTNFLIIFENFHFKEIWNLWRNSSWLICHDPEPTLGKSHV